MSNPLHYCLHSSEVVRSLQSVSQVLDMAGLHDLELHISGSLRWSNLLVMSYAGMR